MGAIRLECTGDVRLAPFTASVRRCGNCVGRPQRIIKALAPPTPFSFLRAPVFVALYCVGPWQPCPGLRFATLVPFEFDSDVDAPPAAPPRVIHAPLRDP